MLHKESIPFRKYTNEFDIPYMAEFANTCREHLTLSGVKSCFLLEFPLYLPGCAKPSQIMFQRKGTEVFECNDNGTISHVLPQNSDTLHAFLATMGIEYKNGRLFYTLYAEDNLKDLFLDFFQLVRLFDDETYATYYGIQFPSQRLVFFEPKVTGTYTLSYEGEITDTDSIYKLCKLYDVEQYGNTFMVTLPNITTRYAIRRLLDFFQFLFLFDKIEEIKSLLK